jgi:hypothetical protein
MKLQLLYTKRKYEHRVFFDLVYEIKCLRTITHD